MDIEFTIRNSSWWRDAEQAADLHYDESSGITLEHHLEAVYQNLRFLQPFAGRHAYFAQLVPALENIGIDPAYALRLLTPVALLHDIGKTKEDKNLVGPHPLSGKMVEMRHPIVGVVAALELLPTELDERAVILALIEEHDTPYAWFRQFVRTQQIPKRKTWAQLDRRIEARGDGTGLALLAIFKLADIDGHENVDDVLWFFEKANQNFLSEAGKALPVPDREAVESLKT